MAKMTREEKRQIIDASLAAAKRGDTVEKERLMRKLPLAPHLALAMKDMLGPEETAKSGFDFSEVEAKHGKDWLTS